MINWNRRSYSQKEFMKAWSESFTLSEVLTKLSLNKSGGSTQIIKNTALELQLDSSHFYHKRKPAIRYSLEEILIQGSPYLGGNVSLRKRLIQAGMKSEQCEKCELSEWMGEPIPLCLDHVNGDNKDFRIENLNVLCQNCHALTSTWCGKNKTRKASHGSLPGENLLQYFCECGKKIEKSNKTCKKCRYNIDKYPSTPELINGVEKYGYLAYAKQINLSDNGLRKLLLRRGLDILPKRCIL